MLQRRDSGADLSVLYQVGNFVGAGYPMSYQPRILYHPTFESYYAAVAALQKTETLQMQIRREQGFPVNNGEYFYTDPLQPPGHRVYNYLSPAAYNMFGLFRLVTPPPIVSPGIFMPNNEGSQTSANPEDPNPAAVANQEGTLKSSDMDFSVDSSQEKFTSSSGEAVHFPKNPEGTFVIQGSAFKPVCPSRSGRSLLEPASTSDSRSCLIQPVCPSVNGRSLLEPVYSSGSRRGLIQPVYPSVNGRSLLEPVYSSGSRRSLIEPVFPSGNGRSLIEPVFPSGNVRGLLKPLFTLGSRRCLPESACSAEIGRSLPESTGPAESWGSLQESACSAESGRSLQESACSAESGRSLPESTGRLESGRSHTESGSTHSVIHGSGPYTFSELEAVSGLLHLSGSYTSSGDQ
ncbi:histone deacetylase complex subunit SAP25 isoform X2 [Rana temporaria]|uniref:histone deacetylase complex subunit SAP25 isoform X2 n=1 Tax=Rana temporaria TaxID=8407 RepID=UPI001AACCE2B|nr:histone deacetylase complex subunit SAP25 isoform X2 [Rana temporaria]